MTPRLKKQYEEQVATRLKQDFGISNPMAKRNNRVEIILLRR